MQTTIGRMMALVLAVLCSMAAPLLALAHDQEKGPHGGQMVDSKSHHVELVVKDGQITVYLSDPAHAPVASKGASGRAVILAGGKQSEVALAPADPNMLTAKAGAPIAAGSRVVVSAKLADGRDVLARFQLK